MTVSIYKLFIISSFFCVSNVLSTFPNIYPKVKQELIPSDEDPGEPLLLTPYLEENRIEEARNASLVTLPAFQNVTSYSGYFTVDKTYDSNLFFWFFPSRTNYANDPVLVWLQGGPGSSSLYGLFTENGPFIVDSNLDVTLREYSWSEEHNLIFIDNPVGTGFSFTNRGGYAQNETKVGDDLYEFIVQFFTLFPELRDNDFYLSGESYGGKYVPAFAYSILKNEGNNNEFRVNLKGVAIGNGWSDPGRQLGYDAYLYQLGLIDLNVRNEMREIEDQIKEYVDLGNFGAAEDLIESLILGGRGSLFSNATGMNSYYNYLQPRSSGSSGYGRFIQQADVRAALHVGNTTYSGGDEVENNLKDDIMQSVAPWVSELLSNYRVLIYNGQLDIICAYPLTVNYLQNLNFSAANEYKSAPRYQWYVDDELAGYVKEAGNLTEVLVRDSGHMVPADQPKWAFDLISRFTRNKPFHSEKKRG